MYKETAKEFAVKLTYEYFSKWGAIIAARDAILIREAKREMLEQVRSKFKARTLWGADLISEILDALPIDTPPLSTELKYCGKCNQRRYFKDDQCEMCTTPPPAGIIRTKVRESINFHKKRKEIQ